MRDRDVMDRLGVPKDIARAALMRLEQEGLLVHSLHRGLEVARLVGGRRARPLRDAADARARGARGARPAAAGRRRRLSAAIQHDRGVKEGDGRAAVAADAAFHLAIVAYDLVAAAADGRRGGVARAADRARGRGPGRGGPRRAGGRSRALLDMLIDAPAPTARAALLDHLRRGESRALAVTHGA